MQAYCVNCNRGTERDEEGRCLNVVNGAVCGFISIAPDDLAVQVKRQRPSADRLHRFGEEARAEIERECAS